MNLFSRVKINDVNFQKWIELCANSAEQTETFIPTTQQYREMMTSPGKKIENFFVSYFYELKHLDSKNAIKIFTQKIND